MLSEGTDAATRALASLTEAAVVVRTGSDFRRSVVHGRIEHVVSGDSEPFNSLEEAVAFMNRHLVPPAESSETAAKNVPTAKGEDRG